MVTKSMSFLHETRRQLTHTAENAFSLTEPVIGSQLKAGLSSSWHGTFNGFNPVLCTLDMLEFL